MKLAIMQPYFLPYIGYFQLLNNVDSFVIYDNIQFTKKGWINRNRILLNGNDQLFSLPLKKNSDYLNVDQRFLAESFNTEALKILRKIENSYRKAPNFKEVYPLIKQIFTYKEENLFMFILNSIKEINNYLGINTEIIVSSGIDIDHSLTSSDKVLAICENLKGTNYINPVGGKDLYNKTNFEKNGIALQFLKSELNTYPQFDNKFISGLSILDVLMFNNKDKIMTSIINEFELT